MIRRWRGRGESHVGTYCIIENLPLQVAAA
jgi:hypothetical protein